MIEDKNNLRQLPKGWVWTRLLQLAAANKNSIKRGPFGSTIKKAFFVERGYKVYEQQNAIYDNPKLGNYFITEEKYNELIEFAVSPGDFIISCSGTIGRIAQIPENAEKGVINQALLKLSVDHRLVSPKYFLYLFRSEIFQNQVLKETRGSAMKNIASVEDLKLIPVALAPLPEQHRIVAKIEELFTKLDALVQALKKVKAQLKRYRKAVLKSAFEGKLNKEWREAHKNELEPASALLERIKEERRKTVKGKFKELPLMDISDLPELPEGWVWARLGDIGEINPKFYGDNTPDNLEVTFLPMRCVDELTGRFDSSLVRMVREVKKGYTPFINGDVIFAKITPCMENGKVAVVQSLKNGIGFGSTEFHVIRLPQQLSRKLLFFFLIQEGLRKDAKRNMTGSAGQLRVPAPYMQQILTPLPPLIEQLKIVEEIERHFSVADEIEKVVDVSLKQAERLRQSILKKAFEGRLVSQDPSDEPAEKLLERIKEEKAKRSLEEKAKKKVKKGD